MRKGGVSFRRPWSGIMIQADGYTLRLSAAPLWITPFLRRTPYDPVKVSRRSRWVVTSPNILVVHPSLPVKSVKELIALLRARPGQLNYATSGVGGSGFLAAELFKSMTRADMVRVNYKSGGLALTDLMSGDGPARQGDQGRRHRARTVIIPPPLRVAPFAKGGLGGFS